MGSEMPELLKEKISESVAGTLSDIFIFALQGHIRTRDWCYLTSSPAACLSA